MYITLPKLCIDCALILPPLLTVSCLKTVMMSYLFCVLDLAQCLAHNRCSINIWHTHKQAREMICLTLVSWKWLIFGKVSLNSVKTHLFSIGVYTSLILCLSIHPSITLSNTYWDSTMFLYQSLWLLRWVKQSLSLNPRVMWAEDSVESNDNTGWEGAGGDS